MPVVGVVVATVNPLGVSSGPVVGGTVATWVLVMGNPPTGGCSFGLVAATVVALVGSSIPAVVVEVGVK